MTGITDIQAQLRRRWTTELSALRGQRVSSKIDAVRVRDMQSFLAAIDLLRKYEFDWRSLTDASGKALAIVMNWVVEKKSTNQEERTISKIVSLYEKDPTGAVRKLAENDLTSGVEEVFTTVLNGKRVWCCRMNIKGLESRS